MGEKETVLDKEKIAVAEREKVVGTAVVEKEKAIEKEKELEKEIKEQKVKRTEMVEQNKLEIATAKQEAVEKLMKDTDEVVRTKIVEKKKEATMKKKEAKRNEKKEAKIQEAKKFIFTRWANTFNTWLCDLKCQMENKCFPNYDREAIHKLIEETTNEVEWEILKETLEKLCNNKEKDKSKTNRGKMIIGWLFGIEDIAEQAALQKEKQQQAGPPVVANDRRTLKKEDDPQETLKQNEDEPKGFEAYEIPVGMVALFGIYYVSRKIVKHFTRENTPEDSSETETSLDTPIEKPKIASEDPWDAWALQFNSTWTDPIETYDLQF